MLSNLILSPSCSCRLMSQFSRLRATQLGQFQFPKPSCGKHGLCQNKKNMFFKLRFSNCWPSLNVPVYKVSLLKGLVLPEYLIESKQKYFFFLSKTKDNSFHCFHGLCWVLLACEEEDSINGGVSQERKIGLVWCLLLKSVSKTKLHFHPEQLITGPLPPPAWFVSSLRVSKGGRVSIVPALKHRLNKEKKITKKFDLVIIHIDSNNKYLLKHFLKAWSFQKKI